VEEEEEGGKKPPIGDLRHWKWKVAQNRIQSLPFSLHISNPNNRRWFLFKREEKGNKTHGESRRERRRKKVAFLYEGNQKPEAV